MALCIFIFYISLTSIAFFCFDCTCFCMKNPFLNKNYLATIIARLRFHFTKIFMICEDHLSCFILAVLTLGFYMSFLLVFLLVCLNYNVSTIRTLIVNFDTLNFMHTEFALVNISFAIFTKFLLLHYSNWCL